MDLNFNQHLAEQGAIRGLLDQLGADGFDSKVQVQVALAELDRGITSFQASKAAEAVKTHERALGLLRTIPGTEVLRAAIQGCLIAEYAALQLFEEAIAAGEAAVEGLADDPRWQCRLAQCMRDLGGIFLQRGRLDEGVLITGRARKLYEKLPGGEEGIRICDHNLAAAERLKQAKQPSKKSWWSRLFDPS
jgi:tetratricopeptide (TPR) repeat protein